MSAIRGQGLASLFGVACVLAACGDDGDRDPFEVSCGGGFVADCGVAYGYSLVESAELRPLGIELDDIGTPGVVEVRLRTCDMADVPRPHRVIVSTVVEPDDLPVDPLDAGTPGERVEEIGRFADDGEGADETARDGVITGTLTPPVFDSDRAVPPNTEIRIRFRSFIRNPDASDPLFLDDCRSPAFDVAYTTGGLAGE